MKLVKNEEAGRRQRRNEGKVIRLVKERYGDM